MKKDITVQRKIDHIELCLNSNVNYTKSNGFDKYEFLHSALTTVNYNSIGFETLFFDKKINFPFIISSMTGGAEESLQINRKLVEVANEIKVPIGLGSQRQLLESMKFVETYKIFKKNSNNIPILANIGISEVIALYQQNRLDEINRIIEIPEADGLYIHLNSAQELFQTEGNRDFSFMEESIVELINKISVPIIVKEVGNGICFQPAKVLLQLGIKGIDVSGSGGTNWQLVEMQRSKNINNNFVEWGLPTSYCVRTVSELKKDHEFYLIASGGIKNGIDIAKSFALGADFAAMANVILQSVIKDGVNSTIKLIFNWFEDVKRIMLLTNSSSIKDLRNNKLIKIEDMF
ncbi:MAG TPA: type 2 isopentenyl-diphosphate Delta-isomerase [Melioribacteraceae bacterium]|nr:type 2 isopentenyl-diphosphate Delta-isomerase [Melioribacteraceae bacterium]